MEKILIKKDHRIFNKYKENLETFRRSQDPLTLVIHGTGGGGSANSLVEWMLSGEFDEKYKKGIGLFNYLIDLSGETYEIIPPIYWTHHAHAGKENHKKMLSVELINKDKENKNRYTPPQYLALSFLIKILIKKYGELKIVSHQWCKKNYAPREINNTINCPGSNFDFLSLTNMLMGWDVRMIDIDNFEVKKCNYARRPI